MGFLSKIFKPVSKVLDKIVPNEVKPFLPYAAAFAPMFAPGIMGSSMLSRGLMSGGLNIGAQLAQEGNEGDINELSALLAGGIGALTAPGAGDTLRGGTMAQDPSMLTREGVMSQMSNAPMGANSLDAAQPFLSRTGDSALNFLAKGADKLSAVNTAGAANPFSMDGLKAAALPFAQGTGDVMYQEGVNSLKDYEIALRDYENSLAEGQFASDSGRRAAIINAMTGNHTQEVIDQTLAELGLRDGGRVNAMGGGIMSNQRGLVNQPGGYAGDYVGSSDNETIEDEYDSYIKEIEIDGDTPMSFSSFKKMIESDYAKGGRVGFKGGGMDFGEEYIMIEGEDGPIRIKKSDYESMPGMFMDTTTSLYGDAGRGRPVPDFSEENDEPNFGGIKEAIKNVDIKEEKEQLDDMGDLMAYEPGVPTTGDLYDINNPDYEGINKKVIIEFIEEGIPLGYTSPEEYFDDFYGIGSLKKDKPKKTMTAKDGGIMNGYNMGGSVLPQGMEMDYRGGGFIPMGSKERADDVPARVSKNEFVMTADAVRAAGGGSINQGAKKMYEVMNNLEARA